MARSENVKETPAAPKKVKILAGSVLAVLCVLLLIFPTVWLGAVVVVIGMGVFGPSTPAVEHGD